MTEPGEPKIEKGVGRPLEEEKVLKEEPEVMVEEEEKRRLRELGREESIAKIRAIEEKEKEKILKEIERKEGLEKKEELEIRPEARKQIIKEVFGGLPKDLEELAGKGAPEDIQKRQEIIKKHPERTKEVLMSLAFVNTPEADGLLEEYLGTGELQANWWAISRGLVGHTSEKAKRMRDWLEYDEEAKRLRGGRWFLALGNLRNSEGFFKFRTRINRILGSRILDKGLDILKLKKYSSWLTPEDSVISEIGNITPDSIKRRERYIEEAPLAVKKSLWGIPPGVSDEIDKMRRELRVEGIE